MIEELDRVVLAADLPEHSLQRGDIGTVVLVHRGGEGFTVEFMALEGGTIAVVTLRATEVRPVCAKEIAHARPLSPPRAAGS